MNRVPLGESLGGQRRTEVGVVPLHQIDGELPDAWVMASARGPASRLVHQPESAVLLVPTQQPVCLPFNLIRSISRQVSRCIGSFRIAAGDCRLST